MDNYIPVKVYANDIKQDDTTLHRLFSLYPKEDIYFELTDNGLVAYLRELDFFNFKRNIQSLTKNSKSGFSSKSVRILSKRYRQWIKEYFKKTHKYYE